MAKFKKAVRKNLRNGAHFSVDEAFLAKLKGLKTSNSKLTPQVTAFEAAVGEEDANLKIATGSDISEPLQNADAKRDKLYSTFKQIVGLWYGLESSAQHASAAPLQKVIELYKIDTKSQYDQETGMLTNFITDVRAGDNAAALEALQLTQVVADMETQNNLVKTLLADRSKERSAKVLGALKEIRNKTDELYEQITAMIEAIGLMFPDDLNIPAFINEWNAELDRIKQQTQRKASSKEKPDVTPVTPE